MKCINRKLFLKYCLFYDHFIECIHLPQHKLDVWLNIYVISQINAPPVDVGVIIWIQHKKKPNLFSRFSNDIIKHFSCLRHPHEHKTMCHVVDFPFKLLFYCVTGSNKQPFYLFVTHCCCCCCKVTLLVNSCILKRSFSFTTHCGSKVNDSKWNVPADAPSPCFSLVRSVTPRRIVVGMFTFAWPEWVCPDRCCQIFWFHFHTLPPSG